VNHTDTRIGLELPVSCHRPGGPIDPLTGLPQNQADDDRINEDIAMVMKGFTRINGEFGPLYVARVFDADGKPIGYRRMIGADLLFNYEQAKAYENLPAEFTFSEARRLLNKGDQSTTNFLKKCEDLGLIKHVGRKYQKTTSGKPLVQ
jgi:hypothetical protein